MPSLSEETYPRPVRRIEVAPGVKVLPVDLRRIPAIGIFRWKQIDVIMPDGTKLRCYQPMEEVHEAWLRVSEAEKLPLGLSAEIIRKLIAGGFVEGGRGAPNNGTVNIISLLEHIEATREDWDFWKRDGRRQRFELGVDFSDDTIPEPTQS